MTVKQKGMKQMNIRLDGKIIDDFHAFCERCDIKGYTLLNTTIKSFAGAEEILQGIDNKTITKQGALLKLGTILSELQEVSRVNGEFTNTLNRLTKKFGIKITDLGMIPPKKVYLDPETKRFRTEPIKEKHEK